jgi:hypothetical protein
MNAMINVLKKAKEINPKETPFIAKIPSKEIMRG